MAIEEHKALVRRFMHEVFHQKQLSALEAFLAPDVVDHGAPPGTPPGLTGAREAFTLFFAAFPDLQVTVEDMIAEGDKVVTRLTERGTHSGPLMNLSPTGTPVRWTGISIFRVADGKIAERWGNEDMLGLLQQLGALPTPAPA